MKFKYLPVVLVLILSGCSFTGDLFIVNHTGKPVAAILHLSEQLTTIEKFENALLLRSGQVLPDKATVETASLLTNTLQYTTLDANSISVEIPPQSTVLVGKAVNRPVYADSLSFTVDGNTTSYSLRSFGKHLKRAGRFSSPHYTYAITDPTVSGGLIN